MARLWAKQHNPDIVQAYLQSQGFDLTSACTNEPAQQPIDVALDLRIYREAASGNVLIWGSYDWLGRYNVFPGGYDYLYASFEKPPAGRLYLIADDAHNWDNHGGLQDEWIWVDHYDPQGVIWALADRFYVYPANYATDNGIVTLFVTPQADNVVHLGFIHTWNRGKVSVNVAGSAEPVVQAGHPEDVLRMEVTCDLTAAPR